MSSRPLHFSKPRLIYVTEKNVIRATIPTVTWRHALFAPKVMNVRVQHAVPSNVTVDSTLKLGLPIAQHVKLGMRVRGLKVFIIFVRIFMFNLKISLCRHMKCEDIR